MNTKLAVNGGKREIHQEIKIGWPIITQEDKDAVMGVLERGVIWGWNSPECVGLQNDFAEYIGTKYCIAMNSGTGALHAAIAAADMGPGDEIIMPAFSFTATAMAALHHNAIPIFVDIDPRTYNIDVTKIEAVVTDRTKAVMPVHLHGMAADMDEINTIAKKYNLFVIEDACQSHGAYYKGKRTGSLGHMAAFSLNTTKNLAGGEGGLFVTDSEELKGKAIMVQMFGEFLTVGEARKYKSYSMGWNYRTQEMPAAFARSQLKRLDIYNGISAANGEYLTKELGKIPGIIPPWKPEDRTHIYHKYRIRLNPQDLGIDISPIEFRDALMQSLNAEGVDAVLWQTIPMPGQPLYSTRQGYGKGCP